MIETPLTRAMARVAWLLTTVIAVVALLLVVVGLARGYPLVDALVAAIVLAVGAIPEGLPAIITIAMAIGVQRMAGRHAVVRRLSAIETLGSTTIICTDKTGTLTRNEMTVRAMWTPSGGTYDVSGVGYAPDGAPSQRGTELARIPEEVAALARAGVLCSDAAVVLDEGRWRVHGDPTEAALIVVARKVGLDPNEGATSIRVSTSFPSSRSASRAPSLFLLACSRLLPNGHTRVGPGRGTGDANGLRWSSLAKPKGLVITGIPATSYGVTPHV